MRPATFTSEQVIEAGTELQAAGRSITGFALRQRIGGGNPSRLKQIWDEHIASSTAVVHVEEVAELPVEVAEVLSKLTAELTERITNLATNLNDKAVKAAERRVTDAVRAAGEQREAAQRELADAEQTLEDIESKLEAAEQQIAKQADELKKAAGLAQTQAIGIAQADERIKALETAAAAAEKAHAQAQAQAQEQIKALKQAAAEREAQHEAALAQARDHITTLTSTVAKQEAALADSRKDLKNAEKALAEALALLDKQVAKAADLTEQNAELKKAVTKAQNEIEVVKKQAHDYEKRAVSAEASAAAVQELVKKITPAAKK